MKKNIIKAPLLVLGIVLMVCCLTSCYPKRLNYGVKKTTIAATQRLLGGDPDTLKVGDTLTMWKYFDAMPPSAFVKNHRNGKIYSVDADLLFNLETGSTLAEDQALVDHDNLFLRLKIDGMPDQTAMKYFRYAVICVTISFVVMVVAFFVIGSEKQSRIQIGICYAFLSVASLATNVFYLLYSLGGHRNAYWFLFSPKDFGWWNTFFFWIAFFVLSATNLVCYGGTILLSQEWSKRYFYLPYVFVALLVWTVVYLFSSNALNDYFLWAIWGIMGLHFIALLVENQLRKANLLEMVYIYVYFWTCLLPVLNSTFTCFILVPLLLFFFSFARSLPGAIVEATFGSNGSKEPEASSHTSHSQKACSFCRFYDHSSECCDLGSIHKDRYGKDAYSCPHYS